MIPYDTANHSPPAPALEVSLSGLVHRKPIIRQPALIDTGADISAIPQALVTQLNLYAIGRIIIEGATGHSDEQLTYGVKLGQTDTDLAEIEVALTTLPFVIIGRDWLKDYYLLLAGPEEQFRLSKEL